MSMEHHCSSQKSGGQLNKLKAFSRALSAKQKQQQIMDVDERQEDLSEEDVVAIQARESFEALRNAVIQDMDVPSHPVIVGERNICQLSCDGKLSRLQIAELRTICESLEIEVQGTVKRKITYIKPLEEFLLACSCKQS